MTMDVGQAEVTTLITIGEFTMINSKKMKNGRIKIMNMHRIRSPMILVWANNVSGPVGKVIAIFVRLTVSNTWLDPATCHPCSKGTGMMISSVVSSGQCTLAIIGSPKFSAPNH